MKRIHKKKVQHSIIFFILIIVGIFFLASFLKERTSNTLAQHVQISLDLYDEGVYTVSDSITLENSLSTIGSFYSVVTNQNVTMQACIVRIMGIAGPVSAVFLHENGNTELIGTAGLIKIMHESQYGITSSQISYWENTISDSFANYYLQGEAQ